MNTANIRLAYQILTHYRAQKEAFKLKFPNLPLPKEAYFASFEEVYKSAFPNETFGLRRKVNKFRAELMPIVNCIKAKHRAQSVKGVLIRLKKALKRRRANLDIEFQISFESLLKTMPRKKREVFDVDQYLHDVLLIQAEKHT